jgi:hypothetical protein
MKKVYFWVYKEQHIVEQVTVGFTDIKAAENLISPYEPFFEAAYDNSSKEFYNDDLESSGFDANFPKFEDYIKQGLLDGNDERYELWTIYVND